MNKNTDIFKNQLLYSIYQHPSLISNTLNTLKKFNFSDYFERSVSFGSTVVVTFREQVYKEHICFKKCKKLFLICNDDCFKRQQAKIRKIPLTSDGSFWNELLVNSNLTQKFSASRGRVRQMRAFSRSGSTVNFDANSCSLIKQNTSVMDCKLG